MDKLLKRQSLYLKKTFIRNTLGKKTINIKNKLKKNKSLVTCLKSKFFLTN